MPASTPTNNTARAGRGKRMAIWAAAVAGTGLVAGALALGIAAAVVSPQLPDVSALANYRPKLPLRVYTAEGVLIGEFGEERRELVPIDAIPQRVKDAVLATEDARFYAHGGIDAKGLLRAVLANLTGGRAQGASTITMQVARNVYLSSERTFSRKFYEVLLAWRLEQRLSKDQILEIYLNQIYLGNRAYGFAAAAQTYFGKPLQEVSIAEAAMLAGLPKAPGTNNPVANPRRAHARQQYVIERMQQAGLISAEQAAQARSETLRLRDPADPGRPHAEYVAETVRQQMLAQYGESAYTRGLKVYTSLVASEQEAAYRSLRKSILDYEQRQPYRGPEAVVELPADAQALDDAVDEALTEHPDTGELVAAVVLQASAKEITAVRANGDAVTITGKGLQLALPALQAKAPAPLRIRRGAVIRVMKQQPATARGDAWEVVQLPEVEGAFVALDPRDGAVRALVGGFDFGRNKFNHVTQAWRQPGSSFKPFIYSAALEKGFTPATVVNDAPLFFDSAFTGGKPWEPKNFDSRYDGPMSLRHALERSKNVVTIRVLDAIGAPYAQEWIGRFGFERSKHPAYLPMALGAGSATPMQMAAGYAVFANGGYRVNPSLVTRVTDHQGQVLMESAPPATLTEDMRAIPERNAFVMNSLLHSVMSNGTGRKAWQQLQRRDDVYGKTGTTNDSFDAWFAGYQPTRVGIAWIGYDTPRQLGGERGETGGSVALPVWSGYMQAALQGVPVAPMRPAPAGVLQAEGEWSYEEFGPGGQGVATLGMDAEPRTAVDEVHAQLPESAVPEERNRILDLFR